MTTPANRSFSARVRFNGEEDAELYQCMESIMVNEDTDQGSSFQIDLALERDEEGAWPYLADERFLPFNRVTILAAFPEHEDVVMDGYVTHVTASSENRNSKLSIRGTDAAYHMNLEEKCRVWQELSTEAIVEQILGEYDLNPVLEPASGGEETPPSVVQRATDYRFVRELARRKGYEFYVRGADAYFRRPELDAQPQKLITSDFGDETNCDKLTVELDATRPTEVVMERLDPLSGAPQQALETESDLSPLGVRNLSDLRGGVPMPATSVRIRRQVVPDEASMQTLTQGYLRRYGFWVIARGELDGLSYGAVLRSRRTVTIKGFGRVHNGVYYVRRVRHHFQLRSYTLSFEAVRNRIDQLGTEDFAGEQPDAAGVPAALGAGADSDVVRVQESGAQVLP